MRRYAKAEGEIPFRWRSLGSRQTKLRRTVVLTPCCLNGLTQVFMMTGDLSQCFSKPRYRHLFDRVHLGLTAVDLAGAAVINEALADEAVITMDTGR